MYPIENARWYGKNREAAGEARVERFLRENMRLVYG
jgi:hypothetical protein